MKNKILNNFGLKVLSVVCAVILWIVVINISDYMMTVNIYNIPVEQINGDALSELDKIYDVASGDTVDIIVKGRRTVVSKLSASDFVATADLSTMSITNTVQIFVSAKNNEVNNNITIICTDNSMSLNLEEKITKQFPIKVYQDGETADKFAVGEVSVTPNIITVEGPESAVNKITEARIKVNVTGQSKSFDVSTAVNLYDAYGEEITNDKMSLDQDTVTANISIYPVKEIPVELNVTGNPKEGYEISDIIYQPQTVLIAGDNEDLRDLKKIEINNVSVSGLDENLETVLDLKNYLLEGIHIAQPNEDIAVTVVIEKLNKKEIVLTDKDITLEGTDAKYDYTVKVSDNYKVIVSGLGDLIDDVDVKKLKPVIKCKSLSLGSNNNVTLELETIDGITYELKGSITVLIEEK